MPHADHGEGSVFDKTKSDAKNIEHCSQPMLHPQRDGSEQTRRKDETSFESNTISLLLLNKWHV